ncbi:MAG: porin family protein [Flavobacterium sp.]
MKKIIFFLFITLSTIGRAQHKSPVINLENFDKQRLYWGYFLGFNSYEFKFAYKNPTEDVAQSKTTGFNVGLVGDLRLMEYLNMRFEPGLYFNQRNLSFPGLLTQYDRQREVRSTYIHLPLLLKFSSKRIDNFRPYLLGGAATALNLSSNSKVTDDNKQGVFRMSKWTNFYEVGFGVDFYLEYFKFSPSIRGVFSINNELIYDKDPNSPWTANIDNLLSRGIFINFTFH